MSQIDVEALADAFLKLPRISVQKGRIKLRSESCPDCYMSDITSWNWFDSVLINSSIRERWGRELISRKDSKAIWRRVKEKAPDREG